MRVLVIGGTGFLGYHATHELVRRGHEVTVLGLPPAPAADLFPDAVAVQLVNVAAADDGQLRDVVAGYDAIVFAAGADDRAVPTEPAHKFFYEANVRTSVRVTAAARQAGAGKLVILGSYFTYFDRLWPDMTIAEDHPYVYSRREQTQLCTAVAGSDMALVVLELPYIFGAMPGAVPLWAPLIRYVRSGLPLYYTNGGTNMIAVAHVAQAIAGAVERVDSSAIFQVGDENVSWTRFLKALCKAVGRKDDTIKIVEDDKVLGMGWVGDALHSLRGKEAGLHSRDFVQIQIAETYFDPQASRSVLGYGAGGLEQAWLDTVAACPETSGVTRLNRFVGNMRQWFGH
ncbi:MAG: NAD(P)-dependent oxidoreductase [Halioglobus sp.]|nr:NAD(P)-dependent oxidoreductase [Halioglobus sp.]